MADVEHVDIQDPQIHEPKGVLTASDREVYTADGVGSGAWQPTLNGIDTADAGQSFISDGAGSGVFKHGPNIHGEMLITGYATPIVLTAAVDPTLSTDSDYVKITGASMWQAGHLDGPTFSIDNLTASVAGSYQIHFWASIEVSATTTLVGVKYAVDGTPPYSTRKILTKSKNAVDINNIFGMGIVDLAVGQNLSLFIAADGATNATIREAGFIMQLLDEA